MNTNSNTNSLSPSPVGEGWGGVVGVYGGSFNPIHLGHTQLGEWLCREGYVDELWFMVSPLNPLKAHLSQPQTSSQTSKKQDLLPQELTTNNQQLTTNNFTLLPDDFRLHLTELAVRDIPCLHVCDLEMHLPRPSFMVRTLEKLRELHPDREFVLVIGADNWPIFHLWKDYEEILRHHEVIIYPRRGYKIDLAGLKKTVRVADGAPQFDISSTQIRQALAEGTLDGEPYTGQWLHPAVWQEMQPKKNNI